MKLSKELHELESIAEKLKMYLFGLRVPESLEGVLEYARDEAEGIADRISYLSMMAQYGDIPDAEFPDPSTPEACVSSMRAGNT